MRAFDGLPPRGGVRKEILSCGHCAETAERGNTYALQTKEHLVQKVLHGSSKQNNKQARKIKKALVRKELRVEAP